MADYRVRIEFDDEYNSRPGDFVAWSPTEDAAYVELFERGDLTAYGVVIEQRCELGGWHVVDSLWGCAVESINQEGTYDSPADVRDEYLRETAADMWPLQEVAA